MATTIPTTNISIHPKSSAYLVAISKTFFELQSYANALASIQYIYWLETIKIKYKSLIENHT